MERDDDGHEIRQGPDQARENIYVSSCVFDGRAHVHDTHQFVVPLNAPIEFETDGKNGRADLFNAVMLFQGARHSFNAPVGGSFLIIDLPVHDTRFIDQTTRSGDTLKLNPSAARFTRYLAREAEFNRAGLLAVARPSLDILATTLLSADEPAPGDARRRSRLDQAHNQLTDPTNVRPVAAVARHYGFSPANFRRVFRREYGLSPQAAVTQARVDHARAVLEQTDQSITAIALSFGYQNTSSFIDAFERHIGMAPTAYRSLACRERDRSAPIR